MFATTYVCEKLFSTMKIVKTKFRSRLTDKYLRDQNCNEIVSFNKTLDQVRSQIVVSYYYCSLFFERDGSTEISQNFASVAQTTTYTVAMTAIDPSSSSVPISLQRDVIVVHRSAQRGGQDVYDQRITLSFLYYRSVGRGQGKGQGRRDATLW
ncbi:hypothetical protein ANN_23139 [Periplaneta americana]|uniref:HAT C-terminal dimerisation domain-containing protein n=1 Tax=Periplaneta americana TaxID=6978 RepID=A0ABQ8SKC7_PERAM|nr:hypothetical protein ANN_23139 [Periplaneta americana]